MFLAVMVRSLVSRITHSYEQILKIKKSSKFVDGGKTTTNHAVVTFHIFLRGETYAQ